MPSLIQSKLLGRTLYYGERATREVLTGTVVGVAYYRGDFRFLMEVGDEPGFQDWPSDSAYQDYADAKDAAEETDDDE